MCAAAPSSAPQRLLGHGWAPRGSRGPCWAPVHGALPLDEPDECLVYNRYQDGFHKCPATEQWRVEPAPQFWYVLSRAGVLVRSLGLVGVGSGASWCCRPVSGRGAGSEQALSRLVAARWHGGAACGWIASRGLNLGAASSEWSAWRCSSRCPQLIGVATRRGAVCRVDTALDDAR